jgi:phosphate acetyltransferase
LDRPAADVSRGSNAHDVLGVAAIVGVQSIRYDLLHPELAQAAYKNQSAE